MLIEICMQIYSVVFATAQSLQRDVGSTLLRTIFELFFQEFCYETHRLI